MGEDKWSRDGGNVKGNDEGNSKERMRVDSGRLVLCLCIQSDGVDQKMGVYQTGQARGTIDSIGRRRLGCGDGREDVWVGGGVG